MLPMETQQDTAVKSFVTLNVSEVNKNVADINVADTKKNIKSISRIFIPIYQTIEWIIKMTLSCRN